MSTWGQYPSMDDMVGSVEQTPLGEAVLNDPRAMDTMNQSIGGMSAYQPQEGPALGYGTVLPAEPGGGVAFGKSGRSFLAATEDDDNMSAWDVIKTIAGAPFNVLRAGKEGLEEVVGHPYAQQREQQQGLLDAVMALPDDRLAALGLPYNREALVRRQAAGSEVGIGMPGSAQPVLRPRTTGWKEILTGEARSRKAREFGALQNALKINGLYLDAAGKIAKIETDQAQAYKFGQEGWKEGQLGIKAQKEGYEVAPNAATWRDTERSKQTEHYAGASENYAQAYQARAKGDETYSLLPGKDYRNWSASGTADARTGYLKAQTEQTNALTPPKVAATNATAASRLASANKALESGVATGRVDSASRMLNGANSPEEKRSTAAGLGVEFLPETGIRASLPGWIGGRTVSEEPDLAGYAKKIAAENASNPARASLTELVKSLSAPPVRAPASLTEQTRGTPESGQVSLEAMKEADKYRRLSPEEAFAVIKLRLDKREITEQMAYDIMAALKVERVR